MKGCRRGEVRVDGECVTANKEQGIFWINRGKYTSGLGFDVMKKRYDNLSNEIMMMKGTNIPILSSAESKTVKGYKKYQKLLDRAKKINKNSGERFIAELSPQLMGLEGKRVEVVDSSGEKRRFWVGKSTGFIPVHLEIHNTRSTGGGAVMGTPFKSVRVVREHR